MDELANLSHKFYSAKDAEVMEGDRLDKAAIVISANSNIKIDSYVASDVVSSRSIVFDADMNVSS